MNNLVSLEDYKGSFTEAPPKKERGPLPPGGGGGDNGDMDERLDRLEKRVGSIDGRLDRLEHRVGHIDGRLGRIEGDVASLKDGLSDVKVAVASLDAKLDITGIRATVEKSHTDIYKWVATLAISLIGLSAAVYFGVQRIDSGAVNARVSQPSVIYVQPAPPISVPHSIAPDAPSPPQ
ncbi:hypothetical protein ACMHYJ_14235 [Castellaniella hirudinis]|uniref:hypothetical protein n=1 Tax=Castellaniella hirudinis TaxID=1144617 RepID=UPI0039C40A34